MCELYILGWLILGLYYPFRAFEMESKSVWGRRFAIDMIPANFLVGITLLGMIWPLTITFWLIQDHLRKITQ